MTDVLTRGKTEVLILDSCLLDVHGRPYLSKADEGIGAKFVFRA